MSLNEKDLYEDMEKMYGKDFSDAMRDGAHAETRLKEARAIVEAALAAEAACVEEAVRTANYASFVASVVASITYGGYDAASWRGPNRRFL